jgi:nucleoside-diphosphate-sugar epimerase
VLRPGGDLDESAPVEPNLAYVPYAAHKLREERCIARCGERTRVPWIHLRLFYLFGRYERLSRLLPRLVHNLERSRPVELSSGLQVRDYTDVDGVATAFVAALSADDASTGFVYHIGSGRGLTIREFAQIVADVVGDASLLMFGTADVPDARQAYIVANPTRAFQRLGWAAPADTEQKIREVARWWLTRLAGRSDGPAD